GELLHLDVGRAGDPPRVPLVVLAHVDELDLARVGELLDLLWRQVHRGQRSERPRPRFRRGLARAYAGMAVPGSPRKAMDSTRVTAFTDGLFVVAATLLVVSIDIPNIPDHEVSRLLPPALDDIVPQLTSYRTSFEVRHLFWSQRQEL